VYNINTVVTNI